MFIAGTHKDKLSKLGQTMTFRRKKYKQKKLAQAQQILTDFLPGLYVAKTTKLMQQIQRPSSQTWFFAVDNKSREPIKRGGNCSDQVIHTLRDRLQTAMLNDQRKVQGLFAVEG